MDPDEQFNPPAQGQSDPLPAGSPPPASSGVSIPPNDPISALGAPISPVEPAAPAQDPPAPAAADTSVPPAPAEPMGNPVSSPGELQFVASPEPNLTPTETAMPESFTQTSSPTITPPAFDQPLTPPIPAPQDPPVMAASPAADPPATSSPVQVAGSGKVKLLAILAFLLAIATVVLFFITKATG